MRRLLERLHGSSPTSADFRALIAATAIVEQTPVVTQDRDYDAIAGLEVLRV